MADDLGKPPSAVKANPHACSYAEAKRNGFAPPEGYVARVFEKPARRVVDDWALAANTRYLEDCLKADKPRDENSR